MTHIIKITRHPTDPAVILAHIGPELAHAAGRLNALRWSPEDRAYLIHEDALPGLYALADYHDAHIHDQRSNPIAGHKTIPQECRHCGQPGRANQPPTYCPACGNLWDPIGPPVDGIAGVIRTPCPSCGHKQSGRFGYCTRCGQPMTIRPATTPPALAGVREHLDEPLPLRTTMEEVSDQLEEDEPSPKNAPTGPSSSPCPAPAAATPSTPTHRWE
jgi:hypothetical protein